MPVLIPGGHVTFWAGWPWQEDSPCPLAGLSWDQMLPLNPDWAWLSHPAVNTDTLSVPRPGVIPRALTHPCLLILAVCRRGKERSKVTPKTVRAVGNSCHHASGGGGCVLWILHSRPDNIKQNINSLLWPEVTGKHSLHISGLNLWAETGGGGGRKS